MYRFNTIWWIIIIALGECTTEITLALLYAHANESSCHATAGWCALHSGRFVWFFEKSENVDRGDDALSLGTVSVLGDANKIRNR